MNDKLMSDIGENYEYVRTIINNKIEIFKIDFSQNVAKSLGLVMLSILLLGMFFIFIAIMITVLCVYLAKLTGSIIIGLLICAALILSICAVLYMLRKPMIFRPVAKLFYSKIADKI